MSSGEGPLRPPASGATGAEVGRLAVQYPGGLAARYRWGGSGHAADVFGVSEASGPLTDHGVLADPNPNGACRLELRIEAPTGSWTARFASPIFDEPQGVLWDIAGLLLVKYGFMLYALAARGGELAWSRGSGTPALAVLASARLDHVLLQTELETIALDQAGSIVWRAAHDDVITEAQLIAGKLDLTTYGGQHVYLDAGTGQSA